MSEPRSIPVMSSEDVATQPVGLDRYAERTDVAAELLGFLQDARADRREKDTHLASALLQAVELVDAAASAIECGAPGQWAPAEVARLRMVTNLLLDYGVGHNEERSRRMSVEVLPFMVHDKEPRRVGRAVLRAVASDIGEKEPGRAAILHAAADLLVSNGTGDRL